MAKKKKTTGACAICPSTNIQLFKHHIIPKSVVRQRKGKQKWKDTIILICYDCHKAIHEAYLTHVHMSTTSLGYCKFNSVRYSLIKKYLKIHHPKIWKGWAAEIKEFINDSMEVFAREDLEDEWE